MNVIELFSRWPVQIANKRLKKDGEFADIIPISRKSSTPKVDINEWIGNTIKKNEAVRKRQAAERLAETQSLANTVR